MKGEERVRERREGKRGEREIGGVRIMIRDN